MAVFAFGSRLPLLFLKLPPFSASEMRRATSWSGLRVFAEFWVAQRAGRRMYVLRRCPPIAPAVQQALDIPPRELRTILFFTKQDDCARQLRHRAQWIAGATRVDAQFVRKRVRACKRLSPGLLCALLIQGPAWAEGLCLWVRPECGCVVRHYSRCQRFVGAFGVVARLPLLRRAPFQAFSSVAFVVKGSLKVPRPLDSPACVYCSTAAEALVCTHYQLRFNSVVRIHGGQIAELGGQEISA
eukprot:8348190-Lingulodinium_polyedra.AAC.1